MNKKLGYFSTEFTRKSTLMETDVLPEVNFEYKPLNMYETACLTDKVYGPVMKIKEITLRSLEMVAAQLVWWDLQKQAEDSTLVTVDFKDVMELRKVSPLIMNKIIGTIRGDFGNPFLDKGELDDQIKNL